MTTHRLRILDEACGPEPSEQWIQSVMDRVRAEAERIPFPGVPNSFRYIGGETAAAAAVAAALIAILGWASLPSNEELAWNAQTGGYVSEYLLPAER